MEQVKNGDTISVNYTGKLEDGSVFDSSLGEGREPLVVKIGEGMLIPGFESQLIGMMIGEKKTIEIESEDAYGDIKPELIIEIAKSQLPETIEVGQQLESSGPMGAFIVTVTEIKEETVMIDANHPLAGKKLIFDLELISFLN